MLPPRQVSGSFSNGSSNNAGPPALPPRPVPPRRRQTESYPHRGSSLDVLSRPNAPPVPIRRNVSAAGATRQVSPMPGPSPAVMHPRSNTVSVGSTAGYNNQSVYVGMTAQATARPPPAPLSSYRQSAAIEQVPIEEQEWYWGSISKYVKQNRLLAAHTFDSLTEK